MLEELNKEPEQEDTKNNASGIKDEGKKTTSPKGNKGSESPNSSHSDSIVKFLCSSRYNLASLPRVLIQ